MSLRRTEDGADKTLHEVGGDMKRVESVTLTG